jgi:pilus assembly protein TadC
MGLAGASVMALHPGRVRRRLRRQLPGRADGTGRGRAARDGNLPEHPGFPGLRDPAMMLELIGAMLESGAGLGRSLQLIATLVPPELARQLRPVASALAIGADWKTAWHSSGAQTPQLRALRDALTFVALTGAPSSALLYAQAARLRRERHRAAEQRAAALGVKLVVPLGLCSLPAFVCLGVVPVLLGLLPA